MNEFLNAMAELDMALTGKDREASTAQFHHMPQTPEDWFAKGDLTWYLSDAGYSRVAFGSERGRLFLTSNSTQRVKARWEAAAPQRQRVEEIMRNWMTSNGWDIPFSESLSFKKLCGTMAAVNCLKSGQKVGDIAKSAGKSPATVRRWVNKAGFKNRAGKLRHVSEAAHEVVDRLLEWGGIFTEWSGYWMDSKGGLQRVDEHVSWARRWLAANHPEDIKRSADAKSFTGVYEAMRKHGWCRIVIERGKIYVKPQNATRSQMAKIQEMAIENRLAVVDELTLHTVYDPRDDAGSD